MHKFKRSFATWCAINLERASLPFCQLTGPPSFGRGLWLVLRHLCAAAAMLLVGWCLAVLLFTR
jgi:hypothetical protein